jgi:hypothetical protein
VVADTFTHGFHDFEVDAQKVIAAHARLAWHTGGHDANIRTRDIGVILSAFQSRVEPFGGAGFRDVERLALGGAFGNVEKDNVAQLFQSGEVSECAPDLSGADERESWVWP